MLLSFSSLFSSFLTTSLFYALEILDFSKIQCRNENLLDLVIWPEMHRFHQFRNFWTNTIYIAFCTFLYVSNYKRICWIILQLHFCTIMFNKGSNILVWTIFGFRLDEISWYLNQNFSKRVSMFEKIVPRLIFAIVVSTENKFFT